MKSLWRDDTAATFADDDLAMRVYTSRLLGSSDALVMHGGGNTSVKSIAQDFFGNKLEVLYVKGSGWDLKTIETAGFPAIKLREARMLAELESLSDTDMTRQLRALMIDPSAPSPSVEAILHAILPAKFIDHTHADAIVTLSNNPRGEDILAEIFPDCLVLPYRMPGFILSRQVNEALKDQSPDQYKGIILMHHGVFTYGNEARVAYENMIELVTRAEDYIILHGETKLHLAECTVNLIDLARIRKAVSAARGSAQLAVLDQTPDAQGFSCLPNVAVIASRGPITPDHVIRTKRTPVVINTKPSQGIPEVEEFVIDYRRYFDAHRSPDLQILDPAPRVAIWRNVGSIAFASSINECRIISDIASHTRLAIQVGESIGGWEALPEKDIFELEYWVLEQAKLGKSTGVSKPHRGKIAAVTGASSGIGKATCEALWAGGAVVVGLDIDPDVINLLSQDGMQGIVCDVTDSKSIAAAVNHVITCYGGLDIVVCSAGMFRSGELIENHTEATWDQIMTLNLTATQRFMTATIPFLKLGVDPSIVIVGSRNFAAPGPGASAYSVSKAGITQLARVAALELAADGVRVNVVHPDAVFDTALWTEEALARSAERYNMSVDQYKTKNLLGREIRSTDVARLVSTLASDIFLATTGAQIPIDGGNDRVI
jgi:rhamnose utilization protein RhaD (predicted bifunctional aldolase and dehydrogenase)/NAD(P)-dependent dehydrogenase (short-subunit alcohol dehydrogenase family)